MRPRWNISHDCASTAEGCLLAEDADILSNAAHWSKGDAVGTDLSTVYVANLPWRTTEDDLVHLFAEFGAVLDVRVIQDPATGRSRGYGFVELDSAEAMERAVASLNGREFNGRRLLVSPARPKRQQY